MFYVALCFSFITDLKKHGKNIQDQYPDSRDEFPLFALIYFSLISQKTQRKKTLNK